MRARACVRARVGQCVDRNWCLLSDAKVGARAHAHTHTQPPPARHESHPSGETVVTVAANVGTKGKRSVWTPAEDASLRTLVLAEKTDPPNWAYIATQMPNRSGKQVRDRYTQVLDPSIKPRGSWTDAEDLIIVEHVEEWGEGDWSAVSKKLPG